MVVKHWVSNSGGRLNRNDDAQESRKSPHRLCPRGAIFQTIKDVLLGAAGHRVLDKGLRVVGSELGHCAYVSGPGIVRAEPESLFSSIPVNQDVGGRDLVVERHHNALPGLDGKVRVNLLTNPLESGGALGALDGNVEIEHQNALVRIDRIRDGRAVEFEFLALLHGESCCGAVVAGLPKKQLADCLASLSLLSLLLLLLLCPRARSLGRPAKKDIKSREFGLENSILSSLFV